jgi:hypothetical protein
MSIVQPICRRSCQSSGQVRASERANAADRSTKLLRPSVADRMIISSIAGTANADVRPVDGTSPTLVASRVGNPAAQFPVMRRATVFADRLTIITVQRWHDNRKPIRPTPSSSCTEVWVDDQRMLGKLATGGRLSAEDMRHVLTAGGTRQQVEGVLAVCVAFNTTGGSPTPSASRCSGPRAPSRSRVPAQAGLPIACAAVLRPGVDSVVIEPHVCRRGAGPRQASGSPGVHGSRLP